MLSSTASEPSVSIVEEAGAGAGIFANVAPPGVEPGAPVAADTFAALECL